MGSTAATIGALNRIKYGIDDAVQAIVKEVAENVQRLARANTSDFKYNSPEAKPPGSLASSIIVQGPFGSGDSRYRASTGPNLVYGKQREFGGEIVAPPGHELGMRFHYQGIYYHHVSKVFQQEYPTGRYLSPAGRVAREGALIVVQKHLDPALRGG